MRLLPGLPVLLLALGAAAGTVQEQEPDGFTTPLPQAVGVVGTDGITVPGVLDPTSSTGLDPGDRDGFSFTMESAGPLSATVDDGGAGNVFVLALAREDPGGPVQLAAVLGAAPLTLSRPDLEAGPVYRVGVAALGDGSPLPYALDLRPVDSLPPWTGDVPQAPMQETEPDGSASEAVDLGDFTGVLWAQGSLSTVEPPGSGATGDADTFRFRAVLPAAARVVADASPGLVVLEIQSLVFVGAQPILQVKFGGASEVVLPPLQPGAAYLLRVSAEQGAAPLAYALRVEPWAVPPPPPPEPLEIRRATLRFAEEDARCSFSVRGAFAPGTGLDVLPGAPFSYRVRGLQEAFAEGFLGEDARGRLRYRAPKGSTGLRTLVYDPARGTLSLKGRGLPLDGAVDPADPEVGVEVAIGGTRLAATGEGTFRAGGRRLVLK
jgi:hypothetical protein